MSADATVTNGDGRAQIGRRLQENQRALPRSRASAARLPRQTLEQMVRRYQSAGFFAGEQPVNAAARISRAYRREYGDAPIPSTRLNELELIGTDPAQAWYGDIERDVIKGNDEYVATFREWSRAARGVFVPRDVTERWHGENGPVEISFTLGGKRHLARARGLGDFLDLCVLTRDVNRAIAGSGRRFELYRPDAALGQAAFVAALTRAQKHRLEHLGWRFAKPSDVGRTFGYGQLYENGKPTGCQ